MAAADVVPHAAPRDTSWTPIIEQSNDILELSQDEFTPTKHIAFKPPSKTYSMKDLQLPEDNGISPFAVSEPFPLFSPEAVMRMRHEVLSPEVMKNCQYSSNLAQCQLRGFARKYAPFVYDVWKHPETLGIISKIAGIELTTEMDLEIGHVNISVKSEQERRAELDEIATNRARFESDEGIAGCPWEVPEDKPIVDWHTDSYPFVCVTMLSDCTTMVGGETALRTGTGEIMKVRGPQMGCAVVLQGRYIEHQALRALGTSERITMVTSFRPKSPSVRDDTVLTTVRPISDLAELYNQFSSYRLEILEERVRRQLKELRECAAANRRVPTARLKDFIHEQVAFLEHMDREMVDEARVVLGDIDDSHLLKKQAEKQAQAQKEDEEDRAKKRIRED